MGVLSTVTPMKVMGWSTDKSTDAASWIAGIRAAKYTTTGCPLPFGDAGDAALDAYIQAAAEAGIPFSEVGAWSNPIDPNPVKARDAIAYCQKALYRAERLGARCCVNIAGSCSSSKMDGPHSDNFSSDTFDRIVQSIREIIDAVKPKSTFYTLETMPWIFPSSPDEYLALIKAIDRPAFAVHLDPVNMINCPARAYRSGEFLRECFEKLGPYIKSCHAKDFILRGNLTLHIDEVRPGAGMLDYDTYLCELAKLDPDTTLCIEHIPDEEYPIAMEFLLAKLKDLKLS
jgi:sugar phosphate isomerase/epimerase